MLKNVSPGLIENVKDLKIALNELTVHDLNVYSMSELYYKVAHKLNEVIRELSRFEGVLSDEVIKQNDIAENDFNLSVNIYIEEKVEREEIDPLVLENEARRSFLERLKRELDFDKMICEMEGISIQPFIKAIRIMLNKYV